MSSPIFSIFPSDNFVDLSLYQFGREQCKPSYSYGPVARNHYLFHYVLSGSGKLMANDSKGIMQTYYIKSNQGFMICPNQITTYVSDYDYPWEYIWIEFDGLRAKEVIEVAGLSPDQALYRNGSQEMGETMLNEMLYLAEHKDEPPLHLIGHLYLFVDALARSSATRKISRGSKLQDFYIHEALSYIEQNFQNDITVEDIAARCGLNRSYFGKIFKDAMGKAPQKFLMTYRMGKAAELLKMTDLSIGEISRAVGYPNQLHFSRAFKNIYSVSPREWRNNNRISSPIHPKND